MCLCAGCHFWWHKYPFEAVEWYRGNFPEDYTYLMAEQNILEVSIDYDALLRTLELGLIGET